MIDISYLPKVRFNCLNLLPDISGIYFCVTFQMELLYIGQSKNINKRWARHERLKDCKSFNCAYVYYLPCELDNLSLFEKDFILKFKPRLNFMYNSVNKRTQIDVQDILNVSNTLDTSDVSDALNLSDISDPLESFREKLRQGLFRIP